MSHSSKDWLKYYLKFQDLQNREDEREYSIVSKSKK
jgi:hypothetical protein